MKRITFGLLLAALFSTSATADADCLLLRIRQEAFRKILRDHYDLTESLLNILAQRIRKQSAQLQDKQR